MTVPNHRQRQFMQHLRGGTWVKASATEAGPKIIETLLQRGWIEKRGGKELSYRITESGLAAKKMLIPR